MIRSWDWTGIITVFIIVWTIDHYRIQYAIKEYEVEKPYFRYRVLYRGWFLIFLAIMILRNGGIHNLTPDDHRSFTGGFVLLCVTAMAGAFSLLMHFVQDYFTDSYRDETMVGLMLAYIVIIYGIFKAQWFYDAIYYFVEQHPF